MSVIYCAGCDRYIDSDFENTYSDRQTGEDCCESCYEPDCDDCDGRGFVAGYHGPVSCAACKGRGYGESERELDAQDYWAEQPRNGEDR
jgi:DnaJ-class molecular chaperone